MSLIFLSHSSRDKSIVRRLATDLESAGIPAWLDEWQIRIGECIPTRIGEGLQGARFIAVALSTHSVTSGWVDREWKAAYWLEVESKKIQILPLLIERCEIPVLLRTRKYADFSSDYTAAAEELIASVKDYLREDAAELFYAWIPAVEQKLLHSPNTDSRNRHWDSFESIVLSLPETQRIQVQRDNTLRYLQTWGLSVQQLRAELKTLGFDSKSTSENFTLDLAEAIEGFQRKHCLRHIDGVFGPLTYIEMKKAADALRSHKVNKGTGA